MTATRINTHAAKTNLSALLAQVEQGKKFTICRNGKAVANLQPAKKMNKKKRDIVTPDPVLSKIKILYDPTEPLTADEWTESDIFPQV